MKKPLMEDFAVIGKHQMRQYVEYTDALEKYIEYLEIIIEDLHYESFRGAL